MCLVVGKNRWVERQFKKKNKIKCYKVLHLWNNTLQSIYFLHTWCTGWNYSTPIRFKKGNTIVSEGIHVFTTRQEARISSIYNRYKIVPVYCHKEDLVAIGENSQAVFKRVYLEKDDYNKALGVK